MVVTHTVHGVQFERTGSCNQCGACGCANDNCSHYKKIKGKWGCVIYDTRAAFCAEHNSTHEICIIFPNHPWLKVIKDGVCSYTFTPVDSVNLAKFNELNQAWQ